MQHIAHNYMRLIILQSIIIGMLLFPTELMADDFYVEHMTSPQVSDMFRYGNVETSLFTGKLNFAIPIYSLEDPDFDLDIALRYNSEGFKPRKHSGYVGYNWFLEAGGCITREVRNIPDEYQRNYVTSNYKVKGMLPFTLYDKVDKDSIFMLHDDIVRECGTYSFNLDIACNYDIDYLPDIFNFNFCGYHGKFMINNQGEVVIIDGDYVSVDLSEFKDLPAISNASAFPTPNVSSRIKIITTDGYTYIFGGDRSSIEYSLAASDTKNIPKQFPTPINTWHLKKVIAPNQRTISFYYKDFQTNNPQKSDPLWMFNEYYDYFKVTDSYRVENIGQIDVNPEDFNKMSQNISKGCIIDSIVVSGHNNLHIAFHNSIASHKFYNHTYYSLCNNNYMLDSILVRSDNRILKTARLTSIYKSFLHGNTNGSGYYWRFLSSVDIDGVGKYLLEYNHPTSYPNLHSLGVVDLNIIDFYGYCKSNVFSGTLKKITYPTGGYQTFTFEENHYGTERRYSTYDTADVQMSSITVTNRPISGIRIASINTYEDNELVEKKTYTYNQKGTNKSSGIYYDQARIHFASDSTQSFLTHSNGCYSFLDSHIGYSYVEEKTNNIATGEEYKVGYTFSIGKQSFNSSTDLTINRIPKERAVILPLNNVDYILSGMLNYDSKLDGNGKLLLMEYYKNSVLIQSTQFEYNGIDKLMNELIPQVPGSIGCTDTIVIFSHYFAPITRKLFVCPDVLNQKIVKEYDSTGHFLINSTNYIYDSKFRIKKETTTNSDGVTYFTKYSYVDDLSFSNTNLSSNPYAFLISQNKIDKPIEVVSGYIQDNLDYITKGQINLYNVEMRMKSTSNANSRIMLDPTLPPVPDSLNINNYVWYPSLRSTLNLHVRGGVLDYIPIVGRGDSIVYDNRYALTCNYSFDPLYRPEIIAPVGSPQTTYTWDGIYPASKTVDNMTCTYTHIPHVGLTSLIDERGLHTGFSYDTNGRLIEMYQMRNNQKEILSSYAYRTKTDPETDEQSNCIVTMVPSTPTNSLSFHFNSMSVSGSGLVNTIIDHYDGIGRLYQSIALEKSPEGNDIASMIEYTGLNRATKRWLPLSINTDGQPLQTSSYISQASSFYNDSRPYQETLYEASALDRVTGGKRPGADYATHPIHQTYEINTSNDSVRKFSIVYVEQQTDGNINSKLKCNNKYAHSTLYKSTLSDEDGKSITTFTDKLGRKILERQNGNDTYYVYDHKGQLCFVLPPLAAQQITDGTHSDTIDVLKKYAYVYKYDERGNQIYKRLPGCEPTLMVYDVSNTLVMSQTGNQRERGNYWTVYRYDNLRRLIYTSEVNVNSTYEGYLSAFNEWYMIEQFSIDTQTHPMANTGYSRNFFHNRPTTLLTVNYYDNYDFLNFVSNNHQSHMSFSDFNGNAAYANATGLLTGTRTYYLDGSGNYSETVYYYDYRGREIQRRTTNHLGGYDVLSIQYDFANNITDTWSSQSTNNGLITNEHYHYTYDHANRPLTTTYTFNNESPIVLQSYHYDELGRVRSRHIHNGIDSIAFTYDIRNQITKIKSSSYEQQYYYNLPCPIGNGTVTPAYNGNISATTWTCDNQVNGYMYYYDNMNRLTSTYSILNNEWGDYYYSENFTYDAHGNITNLYRWDDYDVIDNLYMTYNGNQLLQIEDTWETYNYEGKEYHDNNSSTEDDFAYDANGNMLNDLDRGIAAIRYNLLNLPDIIQFTDGNQIVHRYDAAGNRLSTDYYTRKLNIPVPLGIVFSAADSINKYHLTRDAFHNNIVYTANNNDAYGIEFVHNPEGYIRYYSSSEHYHFYYIKDLLGNIRETYVHPEAGYKECIQRMQYYPSGLPWEYVYNSSEQPWKYNSKEFVEMHGLDEYDSEARWYYPAICRTTTMDPLAEKYYSTSPYAWCGNNPVRFVDNNGRYFDEANEEIAQQIEDTCNTILSTSTDKNQIKEVEKTLDDVQKMREDEEREYRFKLSPTDSKESPSTQYVGNNADGHQVILMTSNSEQINDALFHEIRHGGQIARSELLLDAEGRWLNYGVRKEIDAYKAQWGRYRRLILPINDGSHVLPEAKSINYYGINKAMVHSITENLLSNDYVYPPKAYYNNIQLWRQN